MRTAAGKMNDSIYAQRAQYHDPENAFTFKWSPVPRRQFLAERDRAMDPATGTAEIPLDTSDALVTGYPATTPMILCRYLRIAAGEWIDCKYRASGEIYYVMSGSGQSESGDDRLAWGPGDLFCFPGGGETSHAAGDDDAVIFAITNESQLAFERLEPPNPGAAVLQIVHFPAAEIARRFEVVYARPEDRRGVRTGDPVLHRRGRGMHQPAAVDQCGDQHAGTRRRPAPAPPQRRRRDLGAARRGGLFDDRGRADRLVGRRRPDHPAGRIARTLQSGFGSHDQPRRPGRRPALLHADARILLGLMD